MVPVFGIRTREVVPRASAFAVIMDNHDRVAVVVEGPSFLSLPGGGLEEGESPEACLCREVWEECGWRVKAWSSLGSAIQHLEVTPYSKSSSFFRAEVTGLEKGSGEKQVLWLPVPDAEERLYEGSHAWALRGWG